MIAPVLNRMPCLSSLLKGTALIASLEPWECKQAIISSQEDKPGNKFKERAKKCCKEKKLLPLLMSWVTFHSVFTLDENKKFDFTLNGF